MEQEYSIKFKNKTESDLESLKSQLKEQKSQIEERIRTLENKQTRDSLIDSLKKVEDISQSLIPLQESLNIVWKRTQQLEEEIRDTIEKLS